MSPSNSMQERAEQFREAYRRLQSEIGKVIVGHTDIVHGVLTCLFVGGHALLEGVPGLGKTLLHKSSSYTDLRSRSRVSWLRRTESATSDPSASRANSNKISIESFTTVSSALDLKRSYSLMISGWSAFNSMMRRVFGPPPLPL